MRLASGGHSPLDPRRDDDKELGVGLAKRAGWCITRCSEDVGFEECVEMLVFRRFPNGAEYEQVIIRQAQSCSEATLV